MITAPGRARLRIVLGCLATAATAVLAAALAADHPAEGARDPGDGCSALEAAAPRGRQIFRKGETARGPVEGWLSSDAAVLVGRDAACSNCHGPGGAGSEEGGISVPSLRPEKLFAARERGYDRASLSAALRTGRTPEGRSLRAPMPRYRLDDAELTELDTYLRCLGRARDPGVTEDAVRIGAVLPLSGPDAEVGAAVRDALSASFAEINGRGGVFRRRIDLVVEDSAARGGAEAHEHLTARGVFALVASLSRGDAEIPQILPLEPAPERVGERAFYLYPAEDLLVRVAVTHLARAGGKAKILVIDEPGEAGERWVSRARAEALARGFPAPAVLAIERGRLDTARVIAVARSEAAEAIFFAGAVGDLPAAVAALEQLPGTTLYAPASALAGGASIPATLGDRALFLHAGLPRAALTAGAIELAAILRRHDVAARRPALQARAAVAARVLEEGLRRAGSPPTRDELTTALESLRDFQTGLAPPLSFGRNRHLGVLGAHVLRFDEARGAPPRAATWIGVTL